MRAKIAMLASLDNEQQVYINQDYLNAVLAAGGIGTVLPYTTDPNLIKEYSDMFDGFIFCGGVDIDPKYYGQDKALETKNICSARDEFEYAMFKQVYPTGKPILGICRGEQAINVFLGGTLHQHIEGHKQTEARSVREQFTKLTENGFLHQTIGSVEILTNSFHHQAVDALGRGLVCEARSSDGFIEAIRSTEHNFCLGVQWHPENYHYTDETSLKIFRVFIKACEEYQITHNKR
jgi:putative glutamine amidotransferase